MGKPIRYEKNIFCLETELESDLKDESTSRHFLRQLHNFSENQIKYIYRRCATVEEMNFYFNKLRFKKYDSYSIVYLSSHGSRNSIFIGNKRLDLQKLGELMGKSLSGKLLHFGGCETIKTNQSQRKQFFNMTGITAISGFTKDVTYIEGSALEFLLFERIRDYKRISNLENRMKKNYPGLVNSTGFKIYYR